MVYSAMLTDWVSISLKDFWLLSFPLLRSNSMLMLSRGIKPDMYREFLVSSTENPSKECISFIDDVSSSQTYSVFLNNMN